ncbi:prepilin-type N-terminal cleavage/methylation domain-containing protein [Candidatus Microgenomates bacterium]|nr:MAG: prepilin-type N-terminal cleavage/methylation domain-containing protein [Candidatus Microgenomates bacterium]
MHIQKYYQSKKGFTLIETVVAVGVLGMFFAAIAFILQQVLTNVAESRVRATALSLGQTQMETIRNLPYDDVGTVGGIPSGPLPQEEVKTINSLDFTITTSIIYIDDPFDQLTPADPVNNDYKRVRVEVSWGGAFPSRVPVSLVTNIVPKGVETIGSGGTLYIQVFDANAQPVSNATIHLEASEVDPPVDTQTLTDTNGYVILPGVAPCISCYKISVTKSGYSTDRTYGTEEVANPLQPHMTVITGEISPVSFTIDRTSSVIVNTRGTQEAGYPVVTNVLFMLRGAKIIGYDALDDPVYKYSFSTNSGGGSVSIPALEWDTYTLDFSNSAHNLAGSNPLVPFALAPSTTLTINVVAVPKTNNSLLVAVKNAGDELQASASVQLTNTGLSYDQTKYTAATGSADFGQVFFGSLSPTSYNLKINQPGYLEATASMTISGITQEVFTLNLVE